MLVFILSFQTEWNGDPESIIDHIDSSFRWNDKMLK
jgi:hypothetical protein